MIQVGNIVEVFVNRGIGPFVGIVLDVNDTKSYKNDIWYKVQPASKSDAPGIFWYRENKVTFVADTPYFLEIDGGKDV